MATTSLQRALKKKRPFESAEQEAMLSILRVSDRFENRLGRLFRQHGLTNSQYNVLRILRGEGAPLRSLEIADRMIQVVPAITGLIDRLEKQNLVTRRPCDDDRRVVHVEITQRGLEILQRIDKPLMELHRALMAHLSQQELAELIRLLDKAGKSVEDDSAD